MPQFAERSKRMAMLFFIVSSSNTVPPNMKCCCYVCRFNYFFGFTFVCSVMCNSLTQLGQLTQLFRAGYALRKFALQATLNFHFSVHTQLTYSVTHCWSSFKKTVTRSLTFVSSASCVRKKCIVHTYLRH